MIGNILGQELMGDGSSSYTLPIASSSTLGGIKVGSNLSINSSGVLSSIQRNVVNNLTSLSTTDALSAYQGKILEDRIENLYSSIENLPPVAKTGSYNSLIDRPVIPTIINNLTNTSTTSGLSAYQGKILKDQINDIVSKHQGKIIQGNYNLMDDLQSQKPTTVSITLSDALPNTSYAVFATARGISNYGDWIAVLRTWVISTTTIGITLYNLGSGSTSGIISINYILVANDYVS